MSIEEYLVARKDNPEANLPAPAELVMQLRRLSGFGVLDAKQLLEGAATSQLNERMVRAILEQSRGEEYMTLYDPIQDDPELRPIMAAVDEQIERSFEDEPRRMGFCHLFWNTKQRILREEHRIEWFTPAEMNPNVLFD